MYSIMLSYLGLVICDGYNCSLAPVARCAMYTLSVYLVAYAKKNTCVALGPLVSTIFTLIIQPNVSFQGKLQSFILLSFILLCSLLIMHKCILVRSLVFGQLLN